MSLDEYLAPSATFERGNGAEYSSWVRHLYLFAGIVLLIAQPLFPNLYPFSPGLVVIFILFLVLLAAVIDPKLYGMLVLDAVVSAIGFAVFGYYVFATYEDGFGMVFLIRLILAVTLLFALYFSLRAIQEYHQR